MSTSDPSPTTSLLHRRVRPGTQRPRTPPATEIRSGRACVGRCVEAGGFRLTGNRGRRGLSPPRRRQEGAGARRFVDLRRVGVELGIFEGADVETPLIKQRPRRTAVVEQPVVEAPVVEPPVVDSSGRRGAGTRRRRPWRRLPRSPRSESRRFDRPAPQSENRVSLPPLSRTGADRSMVRARQVGRARRRERSMASGRDAYLARRETTAEVSAEAERQRSAD